MIRRSTVTQNDYLKKFVRNGPNGSDTAMSSYLNIPNSVLFDSGNSDYMSRTPSVAGNRKAWTFSTWVKRGDLSATRRILFNAYKSGTEKGTMIAFSNSTDTDKISVTNDPGNANPFNRVTSAVFRDISAWMHIVVAFDAANTNIKIYINGIEAAATGAQPANVDYSVNNTTVHYIGRYVLSSSSLFDGYLAETILVDGQALTPSSFGQFDTNGNWRPQGYTGTFGTNGFRMDYANSGALGTDVSGNGNNYTTSGLTTSSQVSDSPEDNYAVLNGVHPSVSTLSDGNLKATGTCQGTFDANAFASYWEVTAGASAPTCGVISEDGGTTHTTTVTANKTFGFRMTAAGNLDYINITDAGSWTSIATSLTGLWFPYGTAQATTWNFGASTFAGTASGSALSTSNLSTPAITKPSDYFDVDLYTGTGATLARAALDFSPDLAWIKDRSNARSHMLTDTVRGATKRLSSDLMVAEATDPNGLTSFDTNGFTVGTTTDYNNSGETYAAWCWKKGAIPGFDIVSYTGNATNRTIAHSLGAVLEMMIIKDRTTAFDWAVYHKDLTALTKFLYLDGTQAEQTDATMWNSTAPTSTVFSLGSNGLVNTNTDNFIAYLFTSVPGFSKFGKYTGNGSADGPFIWCGFRPAYVMVKKIDAPADWYMSDARRGSYNANNKSLLANTSNAETTFDYLDYVSNGFKIRLNDSSYNTNGGTYIYAAFAESPFIYARAR